MVNVTTRFINKTIDGRARVQRATYDTLDEALMDMKLLQDVPGCQCLDIWNGPIHLKGWELQNMLKNYAGVTRH